MRHLQGGPPESVLQASTTRRIRNPLALSPGRVIVGDRGCDVLLEVTGSAVSEVGLHGVGVEGRDGGDESVP